MPSIQIQPVTTPRDLRTFVKFPVASLENDVKSFFPEHSSRVLLSSTRATLKIQVSLSTTVGYHAKG